MAKQRKVLISLRSAETLGRVIGTLQRQLDGAMRRFSRDEPDVPHALEAPEKKPPARRRTRPRLSASADPSPSRHPRKAATSERRQTSRPVKKTVKRPARPK